jgi:hypothetical protein
MKWQRQKGNTSDYRCRNKIRTYTHPFTSCGVGTHGRSIWNYDSNLGATLG